VLTFVARNKQVCIEWMEATVWLSIYLSSELILIDTRALSARCPLADAPGSARETPPPHHHHTTWQPKRGLLTIIFSYLDEGDLDFALKRKVKSISKEEEAAQCETIEQRLNSRCKGLLEPRRGQRCDEYSNSGGMVAGRSESPTRLTSYTELRETS
jgi:hypothetical protein